MMYKENRLKYVATSMRVESPLRRTGIVLIEIVRLTLAVVFIFSGFVKAIDPLGYTYKIEDYLIAFGGIFAQLSFLAFTAAIIFSTFELALGLCFLFRVKLKISSLLGLVFMCVMLPLTLYVAVMNPVTDCGCFGDALIISNWQTFFKNIILTAFVLLLFFYHKRPRPVFMPGVEWAMIAVFVAISVGLSAYCYMHLPIIDFRPYKVGVNIPGAMEIPEGKPHDKYDTKLVYQQNGVLREFTLEDYPKNDSTWIFVEQKTKLIQKGYIPPIHDFVIVDEFQNDITDQLLHHAGKVHLLIIYDVNKASEKGVIKAEELYRRAQAQNEPFYALTASLDNDIDRLVRQTGITYPFCKTDMITLKTIVRGNPGLMTIENGTIIKKQNWRNFGK